jgi:hypothetical protein
VHRGARKNSMQTRPYISELSEPFLIFPVSRGFHLPIRYILYQVIPAAEGPAVSHPILNTVAETRNKVPSIRIIKITIICPNSCLTILLYRLNQLICICSSGQPDYGREGSRTAETGPGPAIGCRDHGAKWAFLIFSNQISRRWPRTGISTV